MFGKRLVFSAVVTLLVGGCSWASPLDKQANNKLGYPYSPVRPWSPLYQGMNYGVDYAGYPSPLYPNYQGLGAGSYMRPGAMGYMSPCLYYQRTSPGLYSVRSKKPKEQ